MKYNIALISSILLIVPQAYIFAQEGMEQGEHQQFMGQDQENGQYMKKPEGKQVTEPTGGSRMLPPFGNQGVKPGEEGKRMQEGMKNGSGMMNDMKKPPMNGSGGQYMQKSGSGTEAKMAYELANRKRVVEELAKLGADVSGFTDVVIADPQAFWKLAETFKSLKQQSNSGKTFKDQDKMEQEHNMNSGSGKMDEGMNREKNNQTQLNVRPALTEKARKLLQDKLDKIPTEKRNTLLPKMLKVAQAQLETAKTKTNKVAVRKLEAIVQMIQDEIDSGDDASLIDGIFTE